MKYDVIELANVIRRQYRCHRSLRSHSARGLTDERVLGEANFVARASSRAALKLSSLCGVDDQMKLLQHSWSDMLVLDHIHQRMHNNLQDETTLHNGQKFDLLSLGLLGVPSLQDRFTQVTHTLHDLKFDVSDYICLKFLLLLNPGKLI
ncbi:hypothetical protein V9T40_008489 [Parthenolecanium corni]|uniref:NR LBD domain-containing protein n=1 Tax=Parthenolecanium corni TaxID=536013 RepID=A0AAN9TN83_9HEMI